MGLLEEVEAERETTKAGVPCSVKVALATLESKEAEELQSLLDRPNSEVPHTVLSRVLGKRGIKVPPQQISKHRRGECCGTR